MTTQSLTLARPIEFPHWMAKWLILAMAVAVALKVGSGDLSWARPNIRTTYDNVELQLRVMAKWQPFHPGSYLIPQAARVPVWDEDKFMRFATDQISFRVDFGGNVTPFEEINPKYRTPLKALAAAMVADVLGSQEAFAWRHGVSIGGGGGHCVYGRDNGCAGAYTMGFTPSYQNTNMAYDAAQSGQVSCPAGNCTASLATYVSNIHGNNQNIAGYDYPVGAALQNTQQAISTFVADGFCTYYTTGSGPDSGGWGGANYVYCRDARGGLGTINVFYSNFDYTNCGGGANTCMTGLEPTGAQGSGTVYNPTWTNVTDRCSGVCLTQAFQFVSAGNCQPCLGIGTNSFVAWTVDGGLLPNGNGGTPGGNWRFQHQFFSNGQNRQAAMTMTYSYIYNLTHDPMQSGNSHTGGDQIWQYNLLDGYCFGTNNDGTVICHGEISEEGGYNTSRNDTYQGNTIIIESTVTFAQHTSIIYGSGASNGQSWNNLILWDNTVFGNLVQCPNAYNPGTLKYDPLHPCGAGANSVGNGFIELSYAPYVRHAQFAGNVLNSVGFISLYRNIAAPVGGGGFGASATVTISGTSGTITGLNCGTNPLFCLYPGQGITSNLAPGDGFVATHIVEGVGAGTWTPLGTFAATMSGNNMTTSTPQDLPIGATVNNVYADGTGYIQGGPVGTVSIKTDSQHYTLTGSSAGTSFRVDNLTGTCVGANQAGGGNPNCGTLVLANSEPSISYSGDKFQGYTYFENPVSIDHASYWFDNSNPLTVITWADIYLANSGGTH